MDGLTWKECEILIKLSDISSSKTMTMGDLARMTDISSSHQSFSKVTKELQSIGILTIVERIGNTKIISINSKALRRYINKQPIPQMMFNYFKKQYTIL